MVHEKGKAVITKVGRRYEVRLWEGIGWSKASYATNRADAEREAARLETRWAKWVAYLKAR